MDIDLETPHEERLKVWASLPPEVIGILPAKERAYLQSCLQEYRKAEEIAKKTETVNQKIAELALMNQKSDQNRKAIRDFAIARKNDHALDKGFRFPESAVLIIVIFASSFIFGASAKNLIEASGKGGLLATGGGAIVGALLGFLVDESGKKVFTGISMSQSYKTKLNQLQGE